jgi:hypothetical protein
VRVCYATEEILPVVEERYRVTGTPTFLLFDGQELRDRLLGRANLESLTRFLDSALKAHPLREGSAP